MDELSTVLERFRNTLEERGWKDDTSLTPQPGSTSEGGKLITAPQPTALANPHGKPKESGSSPNISQKDKAKLATALATVCELQRQYGKTAGELETLVEGFCWVLGGYPMQKIIDAIGVHIRRSPTIPTPADIEAIINPPRPKPDWPAYIALMKRIADGHFALSDERRFISECESYAKQSLREGNAEYQEAQQAIQSYQRLQIEGD